jgi:hypothetical protein
MWGLNLPPASTWFQNTYAKWKSKARITVVLTKFSDIYLCVFQVIPYRGGDMPDDDSSENEDLALQIRADLDDLRPRFSTQRKRSQSQRPESGPVKLNKLQKATRSERSIVRANRRLRRPPPLCPRPPLIKTASRQSLHSRRHLANMLAFQVPEEHYHIVEISGCSCFISIS